MIDTPTIITTTARPTAVIRLKIPRAEIRTVMGPARDEVIAAAKDQGVGPAGPWFSYHYRMSPDTFDFEVGVPVNAPITPVGRVTPSELRSARVAHTVYHGGPEGMGSAWGELMAWIEREGLNAADDLWEIYAATSGQMSSWSTELYRPLK